METRDIEMFESLEDADFLTGPDSDDPGDLFGTELFPEFDVGEDDTTPLSAGINVSPTQSEFSPILPNDFMFSFRLSSEGFVPMNPPSTPPPPPLPEWNLNLSPVVQALRSGPFPTAFPPNVDEFRISLPDGPWQLAVTLFEQGAILPIQPTVSPHFLVDCFRDVQVPSTEKQTKTLLQNLRLGSIRGHRNSRPRRGKNSSKGRRAMHTYRNGKIKTKSVYYMYHLAQNRGKVLGIRHGEFVKLAVVLTKLLGRLRPGCVEREYLEHVGNDLAIGVLQSPDFRASYAHFMIGMGRDNETLSERCPDPALRKYAQRLLRIRIHVGRDGDAPLATIGNLLEMCPRVRELMVQMSRVDGITADDLLWVTAVVLGVRKTSFGRTVIRKALAAAGKGRM